MKENEEVAAELAAKIREKMISNDAIFTVDESEENSADIDL
jgi:hypothetical protein